ncbi:hypothetical protein HDF15_001279 [Granulicella mallensis]|uniref:Uncharacterized protein n=1 Tax=Granulicella mallensis TaxID=940614 RepID=A0A7W8E8N4_9BACT|nr:hypothetical protein [Granulicella mallensis]
MLALWFLLLLSLPTNIQLFPYAFSPAFGRAEGFLIFMARLKSGLLIYALRPGHLMAFAGHAFIDSLGKAATGNDNVYRETSK